MNKPPYSVVSQSVPPVFGVEKATGSLRFPSDILLPNMLWMKILRSPHAHAMILEVDTAEAEKIPGVVSIITHRDVPKVLFGPYKNELYALDEELRFVGDAVAAVAAEDWNIAEEALRAIKVKVERLPMIFDPEAAADPEAPIAVLHLPVIEGGVDGGQPKGPDRLTNILGKSPGKPTAVNSRGDVEKGFR